MLKNKISDLRFMVEGKSLPIGTKRKWKNGEVIKTAKGWEPVPNSATTKTPTPAPSAPPAAPTLKIPNLPWTSANDRHDPDAVDAAVKAPNGDIYQLHIGKGWEPDGNTHSDKWQATVFGPMAVPLAKKDGFNSRKEAEDFAKETTLKAMAAKHVAPVATSSGSAEAKAKIAHKTLNDLTTKTAGRLRPEGSPIKTNYGVEISFEPQFRERLDHYGNDGDGWDDEGWEQDYAGPLRHEIESALKKSGVENAIVDIGEKGHVHVTVKG